MQTTETHLSLMGAGDPSFWGELLIFLNVEMYQDRGLSNPSPSANLVGIWKGKERMKAAGIMPAAFFCARAIAGAVFMGKNVIQTIVEATWHQIKKIMAQGICIKNFVS